MTVAGEGKGECRVQKNEKEGGAKNNGQLSLLRERREELRDVSNCLCGFLVSRQKRLTKAALDQ